MDASDAIRKLQAKAVWTDYKVQTLARQPACNYSTCSTLETSCKLNFTSYEIQNLIEIGKKECNSCSTCTTCL